LASKNDEYRLAGVKFAEKSAIATLGSKIIEAANAIGVLTICFEKLKK
jgi:hypothetical protein